MKHISLSPGSQTVWPDATLGPLTRMDSRFPLPGICGPSHNLKSNENPIKILPNQLPDALTSDLQAERQFIAFEQYMNTVAEVSTSLCLCILTLRLVPKKLPFPSVLTKQCGVVPGMVLANIWKQGVQISSFHRLLCVQSVVQSTYY